MIKINLLKKEKKAAKPAKSFSPSLKLPQKSTFYIIGLMFALFLLGYEYMDSIVNYFYAGPPPVALIPPPIQVDTTSPEPETPPDTTTDEIIMQTEAPDTIPEPVEEIPVEEPPEPVQPEVRITLSPDEVSISQQIGAYMALRNSLPPGGNYSLMAVDGTNFASEILSIPPEGIVKFNNNIKNQLPGSRPRVASTGIAGSQNNITIVTGKYHAGSSSSERKNLPVLDVNEIIKRMWTLAKNKGYTLSSKKVGTEISNNGQTKIPLILKFTGPEKQALLFLTAFEREPLNLQLRKISGMPLHKNITDTSTLQLVLQLYVILSTEG